MAANDEAYERQRGVLRRLRRMYIKGEPMAQVQFDLFLFDEVCVLVRHESLCEFLVGSRDNLLALFLCDLFTRHGFTDSAAVMRRFNALFPPEAHQLRRESFHKCYDEVARIHQREIEECSVELSRLNEDYTAVANALYEAHKHEMPEPYCPPTKIVRGINPFNGEPFERRVQIDPDDG